jgi:cytochrome P450
LSSAEGVTYQRMSLPMMLTMDPPDHTRLRKIIARDFSPRTIESWASQIERLAIDAIEPLVGGGRFDFVEAVAGPFPVMVIATVLGIPPEDHARFRKWSDAVVEGFRPASVTDKSKTSRVTQPVFELQVYFAQLIEQRREHPRDDLVTKLLQPSADGRLSETELLWFLFLLLVAGNETTTGLFGNMLVAYATHPEQWSFIRARPDLVPSAV